MTTPTTTRRFPLTGPINLSARLGHGALTVRTADDLTEAVVTIDAGDLHDVVDRMRIELSGPTLTVHTARQGGLAELMPWHGRAGGDVGVVVTVPSGTALKISTFTASVTVEGRCGGADIATASGTITVDEVDGDLTVRCGAADSTVERVTGSVVVRRGSGNSHFGEVAGDLVSGCGSGALQVGTMRGSVRARSGSGAASFGAVYGDLDLATGAGEMSIGLPAGVTARLQVNTGSGEVRSELPIEDRPADRTGAISVRARTGSGDVRLFRAA